MDSDLQGKWHFLFQHVEIHSSLIVKQIIHVSYDSSKGQWEEVERGIARGYQVTKSKKA
jgi:hypothetical protein